MYIDVEAERVAFSIAREGVHYCDCMLEGWLARARIAAERERELQEEIKRLKKQVPKPRPTVTCTVCQGTGWCESGRYLCDVCCGDGWMYYVEEPKGPSDER